ncbi:MAG: TRAP transporter substrate-binding protein [Oscillospiraceae bacterium]|nr:TRAP transporter substrate-binding protein [Oscillospiraceae bacterium]
MKTSKKVLSFVLAALMILALAACGQQAAAPAANSTSSAPADTQAAAPAADAKTEDAPLWDQPAEFEKALATMDLSGVVADVEKASFTMNTHCTENDSNYLYALAFKQAVETLSGGAMTVEVYANGQLFGQADALQAVQQGTLDIANSDTALLANYDKAAGVLDIPFLMKNREQAVRCVQDEEFAAFINKMIEPSDMHLLSILPLNFRNSLVKNMDIDSVDDFKGFIMRTPEAPHTIAAFEAIGATPTVIPSGDAYTSVQTGVADGLEGHAEYMVLQKFYEVAKNYVQTQHVFTFTDYVMSGKVYNALSDKQKAVIDAAAKQAQGVHVAYTANLYPAMYATLEANGCKITDIDRTPFVEATEQYRNDYIEANGLQDLIAKVDSYE